MKTRGYQNLKQTVDCIHFSYVKTKLWEFGLAKTLFKRAGRFS